MNEHEAEPIRGLPERPPPGESILWQGEPRWTALAVRAFHVRKVALYFVLLILWRIASAVSEHLAPRDCAVAAMPLALLALAALSVLTLLALASSRTTVYTITSRRIVLRIGIALPITVNVPFSTVESAAVRLFPDGTGDIPISLRGTDRVAYIPLWPHARPWHLARPEPMLRTVPDGARVAGLLSRALAAAGAAAGADAGAGAGAGAGTGTGTGVSAGAVREGGATAQAAPSESWPEVAA